MRGGVSWSFTVGDGRVLSWTFSLVDSEGGDSALSEELRESWGSFELVVDGLGLCETTQQGEELRAAHWYLLPLAEWLVDNWLALFHEPHLPLAGAGSAAASVSRPETLLDSSRPAAGGRWGFASVNHDELFEQTEKWDHRHRLSAAAPEAPLPDVWLRRDGTELEASVGRGPRTLLDEHVRWRVEGRTLRVPVDEAAAATEQALRMLLGELASRRPGGRAAVTLNRLTPP